MNKKLIVLGVIVLTLVITMAVAPHKEMTAVAAPAAEKVFLIQKQLILMQKVRKQPIYQAYT